MHSSFCPSVSFTSICARQAIFSRLPSVQSPQSGPSSVRSKLIAQEPIDESPSTLNYNNKKRNIESKPQWLIQKEALRRNFPEGWNPPKKISRPSMALLRTLHKTDPQQFPVPVLSDKFKISPEAVRRILKSKWEPSLPKSTENKDQSSLTPDTGTTSSQPSSDGWVHHEKSETDRIPVNLAQALQSSLHSSQPKPFPTPQNHYRRQYNHGTRMQSNETRNGRFKPSNDDKLGSAF